MRLNEVSITGFGGISDTVAVDLSADVTIIAGANGFGKTTICNAIAWALVGEHPTGADPRNLYAKSGTTAVQLTLLTDSGELVVVGRSLANPGQTEVNRQQWNVSVGIAGQEKIFGSAAEDWLKREFANADSGSDLSSVMNAALDSVYMKQESLRDFLVDRSDVQRFSSIAQMVGAGKLSKFVGQLESEKTAWVRATNKLDGELDQRRSLVRDLATARDALRTEIEAARAPEITGRWNEWWAGAARTADVVDLTVPILSEQSLDSLRSTLAATRRNLDRREGDLEALAAEVRVPVPEPVAVGAILAAENSVNSLAAAEVRDQIQVEELRRTLVAMTEELRRLESVREELAALANIALGHVSDHCPACGQEVDAEAFRNRLEGLVADVSSPTRVAGLDAARTALKSGEDLLAKRTQELAEAERELQALRERAAASESIRSRRLERVTIAGVLLASDVSDLAEGDLASLILERIAIEMKEIELRQVALRDAEQAGMAFEPAMALMRSQDRLDRLDVDLQTASSELAALESDIAIRQNVGARADALVQRLKLDSESFVGDRIASLQPLLDQFYSAIDPHPTFRNVSIATKLFGGKQRLDPVLRDADSDIEISDPGRTLSTSQANALAVALFMSFNMGFAASGLNAMILDDPLQNLDDIHLLGLVDLLRRVTPNRQLLLTTHDSAFASLLARKLRPLSESARTQVVRFTKWDRSGPGVETVDIPYEGIPVKIAVAS